MAWSVVSELEELAVKAISRRFDLRFEKVSAFSSESSSEMLLERCIAILERAEQDSSRVVKRAAEKIESVLPELVQSESTRMGLALLLSQFYRKEFYGQKDATVLGNEMARIGVEEEGGDRGGFHGGHGGHGGPRRSGGGGDRHRRR